MSDPLGLELQIVISLYVWGSPKEGSHLFSPLLNILLMLFNHIYIVDMFMWLSLSPKVTDVRTGVRGLCEPYDLGTRN